MLGLVSIATAQNPNSNAGGTNWKLTGNQTTTTDFVGTTNTNPLVLKCNNIKALEISADTSAFFMGNVVLEKLRPITPQLPNEIRLVTADNNGKLTSLDRSGLVSSLYNPQLQCFVLPNNQLPAPIWSATPGVLYTGLGCPASVGIGTNVPVAALDVRGAGFFQGLGVNTTPTNTELLKINNTLNRTGIEITNNHPTAFAIKYGIKNIVNNPNTIAYSVTNQNNQDVFVVKGNGSVGIGTNNPDFSKLNVVAQDETGLTVTTNHTGDYGFGIRSIVAKNKTKAFSVYNAENNEESFVVLGNGNVGIGTTAVNGAKLSVEGTIRTRKVQVDNPNIVWADFVFETNYSLMPLNEVEYFITQNKHLPNVPSATEVKENGIDLAQMDAILLQKIEELTLYVLQLKKENELLKDKMLLLEK